MTRSKLARNRHIKYNYAVDGVVFEGDATDINMANCEEEGAKVCIKVTSSEKRD